MGLIPEESISQVLDRCDIVELISSYVALKKAGRNFKGNCPFHDEKTPSFIVNPDKQIFHCFGCDAGGNAIGFVMKHEHMTFPEAVRLLAQKVNVTIPDTGNGSSPETNTRQLIFKVNTLAAEYFHHNLLSVKTKPANTARAYLKKRQIDLETVKVFQLGFAMDQWDGLINFLRDRKVSLKLMEKAGLIISRDKSEGYYDRFRNRIVFPIMDTQANCRAFGARAMESVTARDQASAKYINSPETAIYIKGHHLYGFHLAKKTIVEQDAVIIVEGYMDCIMPHQAGVRNVVASLGTALTVEQIRLLRRYTKNVVMLFDMDAAGESAMVRSLDALIEEDINVKVATLTQGHDPDSFIRSEGPDAFRQRISEAKALFDYKLGVLLTRYDVRTIEGKAGISGEMLQTIEKFNNAVLKSGYLKRLSQELAVPEQALEQEMAKIRQMTGDRKNFGYRSAPKTPVAQQVRVVEQDILALLLLEESFILSTKKEIHPSDFQDYRIRLVISKIFDLCDQGKEINSAELINSFEDKEIQQMITRLMTREYTIAGDRVKMHNDYINRMKNDRKKLRMQALQEQISEAEREGNQEKVDRLLEEYNNLVKEATL